MKESKLFTFSSSQFPRFIFLTLVIFCSLASGVFIRKTQQFNQNGVIGEITMELRDNGSGDEHLQGLLINNAQLMETELDYASELANLFLSSIENELIEDHYIEKQSPAYKTIEEIKGVVGEFEKAEHEYFENVQKKGNKAKTIKADNAQDDDEEDKIESEDDDDDEVTEVFRVVLGDTLQPGAIINNNSQQQQQHPQSNDNQAAANDNGDTESDPKIQGSIKYNNSFDMQNQKDPARNQKKIENSKTIPKNTTTSQGQKPISSSTNNQKNQGNDNILSQLQTQKQDLPQGAPSTDPSSSVQLNRTAEKGTMRLKLPEVSLPSEKQQQQQQQNKQKELQQTRFIFGIIAIIISIITVTFAICRFTRPAKKQLPINHEGVSLIQSRNEIQQQNLSKLKDS